MPQMMATKADFEYIDWNYQVAAGHIGGRSVTAYFLDTGFNLYFLTTTVLYRYISQYNNLH